MANIVITCSMPCIQKENMKEKETSKITLVSKMSAEGRKSKWHVSSYLYNIYITFYITYIEKKKRRRKMKENRRKKKKEKTEEKKRK